MRVALTVAGSDPSGGAGVQADLKTFSRFGVYGAAALTLLTVQNTLGVRRVELLPPDFVYEEIRAVAEDLPVHALKTGALGSAPIVEAVAKAVRDFRLGPLVVDPVMVAKSGDPLLGEEAVAALKEALLPLAFLVTPNRMEAERLLGSPIRGLGDAEEAAMALLALGPKAVLLKGGHLPGVESVDLLATGKGLRRFSAPRVETRNTHGTGCTLSAAIAAHLALGRPLEAAVLEAKAYLTRALESAPSLGHGHGPLNHFA
jgi:hydroxymethylpyrimidine/phosphomethylpyrimidine kinase